MVAAALGGEFEVPTIDRNNSRVKVPEGTQSGRRFRLHGKGMPVLRSKQTGDMYVQVLVETPQRLTRRQRELLDLRNFMDTLRATGVDTGGPPAFSAADGKAFANRLDAFLRRHHRP